MLQIGYTKSWRKKYAGKTASRGLLYIGAMDWLVGNANWDESWYNGRKISRGQIVVGRKWLATEWKVSEQSVRTILKNLSIDGFLTIEPTTVGTIVTILNYDIYQGDDDCNQPTVQPSTNHQSTIDQPLRKNSKNDKNKEEYKEESLLFPSVFPFEEFWNTYDKKVERSKCEKIYSGIKEDEREKIKSALPAYVQSTPEVKYRKNPQTWLNGKCWNDEIPTDRSNNGTKWSKEELSENDGSIF